jgi:hypothetical protein
VATNIAAALPTVVGRCGAVVPPLHQAHGLLDRLTTHAAVAANA